MASLRGRVFAGRDVLARDVSFARTYKLQRKRRPGSFSASYSISVTMRNTSFGPWPFGRYRTELPCKENTTNYTDTYDEQQGRRAVQDRSSKRIDTFLLAAPDCSSGESTVVRQDEHHELIINSTPPCAISGALVHTSIRSRCLHRTTTLPLYELRHHENIFLIAGVSAMTET